MKFNIVGLYENSLSLCTESAYNRIRLVFVTGRLAAFSHSVSFNSVSVSLQRRCVHYYHSFFF